MITHTKDTYVFELTVGLDDGALEGADYFEWDKGE